MWIASNRHMRGLHDQAITFLSQDHLSPFQLKLAGNAQWVNPCLGLNQLTRARTSSRAW